MMPSLLSLYLDLVRFTAAVAVLLSHLSSPPFTEGIIFRGAGSVGTLAVTVFFVLSGHVISYVTSHRDRTAIGYAAARISRLYSVVIVALLLTFLLDSLGMLLNPDFYSHRKMLADPPSVQGYAASFLLVNEFQSFGFNGICPGTNAPWWTLSFEAAYYLIAGLFIFLKPRISVPLCLLALIACGRTICALFPLWMMGFLLYRVPSERLPAWPRRVWASLFAVSAVLTVVSPMIAWYLPSDNYGHRFPYSKFLIDRNLVADYLPGALFCLNLVTARKMFEGVAFEPPGARIIRWFGSLTFPLYLSHYPAMCLLAAVSPCGRDSWAHLLFLTGGILLLVVALTPVCERLKTSLRSGIMNLAAHRKTACG